MLLQVGVDCEEISRFRNLPYDKNKRFYRKIFTEKEIAYCRSCRDPYPRFAARFTAKEATIKALHGIAMPRYADMEVRKGRAREPRIFINKKRRGAAGRLEISLSITHSRTHAVAFVVVTEASGGAAGRRVKDILENLKRGSGVGPGTDIL